VSAEIQNSTAEQVIQVASSGGVFDVKCDGVVLFSKFETGRFPEIGEIAALL